MAGAQGNREAQADQASSQAADQNTRLFCFASAGSTAGKYRRWSRYLPTNVEVIPVELPGRGQRWNEALLYDFSEAVDAMMREIVPLLGGRTSFFGHSMGAFFCLEVAHRIMAAGGPLPAHLFFSSVRAPQILARLRPFTELTDEEFVERIVKIQGTPRAVLESSSAMELYMPILRADASLFDTMKCSPRPALPIPISVFGGDQDPEVSVDDLKAWSVHTSKAFELNVFSGGHFFFQAIERQFVNVLATRLSSSFAQREAPDKAP